MAIQTETTAGAQATYGAYGAEQTTKTKSKNANYGKTIGKPELSEKGQKYYEELKKKFGDYDFILVSKDEKANAQANAAKYANPVKTVVLIDEEKIEKMATDESYRKKYEGILANASSQISKMKEELGKSGANVQGFGMQVNDDGTTKLFAVLKKSSSDQKTRIEKKAAEKKEAKKVADKKAAKKEKEERLRGDKAGPPDKEPKVDEEETITITANSVEELMEKLSEHMQNERMNAVQTDAEKMVGQNFDFNC